MKKKERRKLTIDRRRRRPMTALQMTWQHRRKGAPPLGLKNLGNTCYLNSVLQCLTYTPPLAQFCLSSHHSSLCKSALANKDKECPFCILERQITRLLSLDGPLDAPSKIQKCLALFAESFRLGRQEDAHEFLRYVIDACHSASLKLAKRLAAAPNGKAKVSGSDGGAGTVMKEIFGGALLSQVKCLSCKGESNKTDEIMDISLDVYQSNSLMDALARFFQPEVLDGSNKYSCEKCKKLSVAKKQMFVLRAPNVLVIQLKRFEGVHGNKINRNIEFEEVLGLSKFMYNTIQDAKPVYNLFGSIVHSGYSQEPGHYYAYIKDALGRWYCCNDAHISLSSSQQVLSEKVYILFYLLNNQSPRPIKSLSLSSEVKPFGPNGTGTSQCHKPKEVLKPSPVTLNGSLSLKSNGTAIIKNGKTCQRPQVKSINLKNFELTGVKVNGNSNPEIHKDAFAEKCNGSVQPKSNEALYSPNDEAKMVNSAMVSSVSNGNIADGSISSDMLEHNRKQTVSIFNGSGHSNQLKANVNGDIGSQLNFSARKETGSNYILNNAINNSVISASKENLSEAEEGSASLDYAKLPGCLSKEDASLIENSVDKNQSPDLSSSDAPRAKNTNYIKHFPEEIEKFKEVLAREAYSSLQSCDWYDSVHKFMRARKRLLIQETSGYSNKDESRKQLKTDAKRTFASQIPESLKAHLIEQLLSFYQGK